MRLGVFLPNWIGDVVMATPALDALRQMLGPDGRMVGVMKPYVTQVVDGLELFDRVILSKRGSTDPTQTGRAVIRNLHDEQLDAIVLMPNSIRTAWLAWRSGTPERIGYQRDGRSWMLSTRLAEPVRRGKRQPLPTIDSYLNLAYAAGADWRAPTLRLATTEEDRQHADDVWNVLDLPAGERVVVFNTGGAYGDAKSWPADRFAELAKIITNRTDDHILVNCGPAERDAARKIVTLANNPRVVSLADFDSPIGLSKEVIRRSRVLITTDSGPRFFGIAFGKQVITLFGPTDPNHTKTHYPLETTLSLSLNCQPCWERSCPLGHHRCMKDLSPERVFSAFVQGPRLLSLEGTKSPPTTEERASQVA